MLQVVPFPDPETGLIYQPENENSISFTSEFIVYNPRMKYSMNFPDINFCGESNDILLIVGTFPLVSIFYKILSCPCPKSTISKPKLRN